MMKMEKGETGITLLTRICHHILVMLTVILIYVIGRAAQDICLL